MAAGSLTALQTRMLVLLAGLDPSWRLTGDSALAAAHTKHRPTRDLDCFWSEQTELGGIPDAVIARLSRAQLSASVIQREPQFARIRVESATILVDTRHEILVNKLCALLGRSELRDLEDVRVLLEAGESLRKALGDAPAKDGGFSPLTLAWVLKNISVRDLAQVSGWSEEQAERLEAFRDDLVARTADEASPE